MANQEPETGDGKDFTRTVRTRLPEHIPVALDAYGWNPLRFLSSGQLAEVEMQIVVGVKALGQSLLKNRFS